MKPTATKQFTLDEEPGEGVLAQWALTLSQERTDNASYSVQRNGLKLTIECVKHDN